MMLNCRKNSDGDRTWIPNQENHSNTFIAKGLQNRHFTIFH